MKIAITGHRPHKLGNDYDLTSPLINNIKLEIIHNLERYPLDSLTLISGMALGIDTLFALIAIELELNLIAAIPFKGQESKWPFGSRLKYNYILSYEKCEKIIVSGGGYHPSKMQKRNEWMVDNCDVLIAVWDGTAGGTANCVEYAKDKKQIIRINPNNYRK
jgi:uncharacterized phage-like protein YoqJ